MPSKRSGGSRAAHLEDPCGDLGGSKAALEEGGGKHVGTT